MTHQLIQAIKNQWRYLLTAIQFFTRIPVHIADFNADDLNKSTRYFPLIGIVVGSIGALAFVLLDNVLPLSLAVLLSMVATLMVTGGFHEDGLADATDGLGGGWKKEQVLKIMVDSRIGTYGALALVMALLIKHQALVEQSAAFIPSALIAGHALSRFCAVLVIVKQDYVKTDGKAKPLATKINRHELAIAALFGLAPLCLLLPYQWFALIPVALIWHWFSHKINTRIGGYTGDCLGAMQQLTEVSFYIGLLMSHELNILANI
jgi:adenosylcobinamide-GDP ribazoletransferase